MGKSMRACAFLVATVAYAAGNTCEEASGSIGAAWSKCVTLTGEGHRWHSERAEWRCDAKEATGRFWRCDEAPAVWLQTSSSCPQGFTDTTPKGRASFTRDSRCGDGGKIRFKITECSCYDAKGKPSFACKGGKRGQGIFSTFDAKLEGKGAKACPEAARVIQHVHSGPRGSGSYMEARSRSSAKFYAQELSVKKKKGKKKKTRGASKKQISRGLLGKKRRTWRRRARRKKRGKKRRTWQRRVRRKKRRTWQRRVRRKKRGKKRRTWQRRARREEAKRLRKLSRRGAETLFLRHFGKFRDGGVREVRREEAKRLRKCLKRGCGLCGSKHRGTLKRFPDCLPLKQSWKERKISDTKWATKPGHRDALDTSTERGRKNRRHLETLLEAAMQSIKLPPAAHGSYGSKLTLGMYRCNKPCNKQRGTKKPNCCGINCGTSSGFGGYPIMWDQDAVQPFDIDRWTWQGSWLNMKRANILKRLRAGGRGLTLFGNTGYPAPCQMPKEGVPQGAHLLRIVPCFGELNSAGVFCALVKVTVGEKPLVEGWGEIRKPMIGAATPATAKLGRGLLGRRGGKKWRKNMKRKQSRRKRKTFSLKALFGTRSRATKRSMSGKDKTIRTMKTRSDGRRMSLMKRFEANLAKEKTIRTMQTRSDGIIRNAISLLRFKLAREQLQHKSTPTAITLAKKKASFEKQAEKAKEEAEKTAAEKGMEEAEKQTSKQAARQREKAKEKGAKSQAKGKKKAEQQAQSVSAKKIREQLQRKSTPAIRLAKKEAEKALADCLRKHAPNCLHANTDLGEMAVQAAIRGITSSQGSHRAMGDLGEHEQRGPGRAVFETLYQKLQSCLQRHAKSCLHQG